MGIAPQGGIILLNAESRKVACTWFCNVVSQYKHRGLWVVLGFAFCIALVVACVSGSGPEERDAQSASLTAPTFAHTVSDPRNFSFLAVGDTHLSGGNVARVRAIMDAGTARGSAFLTILGDIVDRGAWENYDTLNNLVVSEGWTGRFFPLLGNHDIVGESWNRYRDLFGPSYYSFDIGNSRFLVLDSADGMIGEKQWRWFESELNRTRPEHTFVFTHYMPVIPGVNTYLKMSSDEQAARFMSLCSRHGVSAVLGGHYHSYAAQTIGGTQYIVSGGGGGRRMEPVSQHFYVEVTIDGSEVRHQLHLID
jgi:3',5'-cyclic AMP phosphodiesterase CpdA